MKIPEDGKIYTEGATSVVGKSEYMIECSDGSNNVSIPLKLSIESNSGSIPLQYFQYPTNDFNFYVGKTSSIKPVSYSGILKSCTVSTNDLGNGVSFNSDTCELSGTFTGSHAVQNITITATSLGDLSSCTVYLYVRYLDNTYDNYIHGFLIKFYRFKTADCVTKYFDQDYSKRELIYLGVRDHINYTTGSSLWPEYGWHLEQQSSLSSFGFYHGNTRTWFGNSGSAIANLSGSNWPSPGFTSQYVGKADCSVPERFLWGNPGANGGNVELHQHRGIGSDDQFKYVITRTTNSGSGDETTNFIDPSVVSHIYLGYFEYSLMKALYPAHTLIPINKPVLQTWITDRAVESYEIDRELPIGFEFDINTGIISGYADEIMESRFYTITLKGLDGNSPFIMRCEIEIGIEEFISSENEITCNTTVLSGRLDEEIIPINCSSINGKRMLFHSTDLPSGINLNENGLISGIGLEEVQIPSNDI